MELYNFVISEKNIYNAIYSLESYVFEKGLLNKDDMEMYNRLSDKYDTEYIKKVIGTCQERLKSIYTTKKLFEVKVYFKLKKYNEELKRFDFRPIHTTSLIDQICMTCMLQPLMFDDDAEKRALSEVSKLIPHNFYGNIPSIHVDEIFVRWQYKYKEYSEKVINKCHEYRETQQYRQEVCLDLKEFFPSINPTYVYDFIYEKMKLRYKDSLEELKLTISKLLYFHILTENMDGWVESYYQGTKLTKDCKYMNRGIAQGLPQSYYFGNIYMIKVAELTAEFFKGDTFYYVDDSVIFTNEVNPDNFQSKITMLNQKLKELNNDTVKHQSDCFSTLSVPDQKFQKNISYGAEVHSSGKSFYTEIDDSYDGTGGLQYLTRQVSMAAFFGCNMDEIEDNLSREKLEVLLQVINSELSILKKKNTDSNNYRTKLLKRYKKYFLYRLKQLQIREDGKIDKYYLSRFYYQFQIELENKDLKNLSDTFDEEIFQSESRMIVNLVDTELYKEFCKNLITFEESLSLPNSSVEWLYYRHDIVGAKSYSLRENLRYRSLSKLLYSKYHLYTTADFEIKSKVIDNFVVSWKENAMLCNDYTEYIASNSEEYLRRIMNAFYSTIYGVDVNDRHNFCKNNNRSITYTELRILAYLRNVHFNMQKFKCFACNTCHEEDELLGRMHIDMAILEVLHLIIVNVKDPEHVDDIILTHRLVSGLWKNGSKFLNAYTLHNEDHAIKLIQQCMRIIKVVDYLGIKHNDYYVLFLACYLHDISMVIHPDMNELIRQSMETDKIVTRNILRIKHLPKDSTFHDKFRSVLLKIYEDVYSYFETKKRNNHPHESAVYIRNHSKDFLGYVNDAVLDLVALVSESHGFNSPEVYGRKSSAKSQLYSIKYMMILIRMADLMDMCNDRVNYFRLRENLSSLSITSRFHWTSHLITDNAYITARYKANPSKKLFEHPITETIQVSIFLNVDYSATIASKNACKGCQAEFNVLFDSVGMKSHQYKGKHCIQLKIMEDDYECICQSRNQCPIICAWMTTKNRYLINELVELKRYLNQANSRLFTTEFEVLLIFGDIHKLDSDMFDNVHQYLLTELT